MNALFDTNILIDFLRGVEAAHTEIASYDDKTISIISYMEVMAGTTPANEAATRAFLQNEFDVVHLDGAIAERAIGIRREKSVKLPDAIIWATAAQRGLVIITRNRRDFPADDPKVRIPYDL